MRGADGRDFIGTEMAKKYYLVSDLHMGGDGQLQHCDYAAEFIAFLKGLEKEDPETELLIVGDTFGFWELTLVARNRKARPHHQGPSSHFRSAQGHRGAHQGDHDGRQSRLRPGLRSCLCGQASCIQHPFGHELGPHPLRGRQEDLDRTRPAARHIQRLPRLWQSARASRGLLHHRNVRQRGQPVFGLRQGRLAQGHSFGRHDADSRLVPVELFLPRDEHDAALVAAPFLASLRADGHCDPG